MKVINIMFYGREELWSVEGFVGFDGFWVFIKFFWFDVVINIKFWGLIIILFY